MSDARVQQRLRAVVGASVPIEHGPGDALVVSPPDDHRTAAILETASAERWPVGVRGAGTWSSQQPNALITIDPSEMADVTYLDPSDLVVTAQAGMQWSSLRATLAEHGAWLPIDPPGERRSVGSVVATGTAGPLRCGYGAVRDHVLGATLATGDGKLMRAGSKVVKNVAGFDLVKLATGSFGAFGLITDVTFRLRAVPRADATLVARGNRDRLLQAAFAILERGANPAALELYADDPDDDWILGVRLIATDEGVQAARDTVAGAADLPFERATDGATLWRDHAAHCLEHPATLRVGVPPRALPAALDLIRHDLGPGWTSATVFPGAIRWSGASDVDRIKVFRHHAAHQEFPVTVERAPVDNLAVLGHFGAYREGVGRLIGSLRTAFDPHGIFVVPERAA